MLNSVLLIHSSSFTDNLVNQEAATLYTNERSRFESIVKDRANGRLAEMQQLCEAGWTVLVDEADSQRWQLSCSEPTGADGAVAGGAAEGAQCWLAFTVLLRDSAGQPPLLLGLRDDQDDEGIPTTMLCGDATTALCAVLERLLERIQMASTFLESVTLLGAVSPPWLLRLTAPHLIKTALMTVDPEDAIRPKCVLVTHNQAALGPWVVDARVTGQGVYGQSTRVQLTVDPLARLRQPLLRPEILIRSSITHIAGATLVVTDWFYDALDLAAGECASAQAVLEQVTEKYLNDQPMEQCGALFKDKGLSLTHGACSHTSCCQVLAMRRSTSVGRRQALAMVLKFQTTPCMWRARSFWMHDFSQKGDSKS